MQSKNCNIDFFIEIYRMADDFDGTQLRKWRKERNYSRDVVAGLCNVSASSIHNWESGRSKPHPSVLPLLRRLMHGEIAIIPLTETETKLLDRAVDEGGFTSREDFLASALVQVLRGDLIPTPSIASGQNASKH